MNKLLATAAVAVALSTPAYAAFLDGERTYVVTGDFVAGAPNSFAIDGNPFTFSGGADDFANADSLDFGTGVTIFETLGGLNNGKTFDLIDTVLGTFTVRIDAMSTTTSIAPGKFANYMFGTIIGGGTAGADILVDITFATTSTTAGTITLIIPSTFTPVPVPASLPLFLAGIAGIGALVRRKG